MISIATTSDDAERRHAAGAAIRPSTPTPINDPFHVCSAERQTSNQKKLLLFIRERVLESRDCR
ncbi:hypothetical protein TYRP_010250 [Tyrophagus putrescentiae]|nr:hypothetical protein TYRP_010250 [Tyrophagus putrescentiae]